MQTAFLAESINITDIKNAYGSAESVYMDNQVFHGSFTYYQFKSGIRMTVVNGRTVEPSVMMVVDKDWIRFNFALSIDIDMEVVGHKSVRPTSPSWRIIDHPANQQVNEAMPGDTKNSWVTVVCKKELIEKITELSTENLPELFRAVEPTQYTDSLYKDFNIPSKLMSIVSDLISHKHNSAFYIPYMEARAMELLVLALDELLNPFDADQKPPINKTEQQKISKAKTYIQNHFQDSPTVTEIASYAGINRTNLYYGFKTMFGENVSEFIHNLKLEEAHRLIIDSDYTLQDIASTVGFKHQSGLTTAFKKKFGITPGQLRRS